MLVPSWRQVSIPSSINSEVGLAGVRGCDYHKGAVPLPLKPIRWLHLSPTITKVILKDLRSRSHQPPKPAAPTPQFYRSQGPPFPSGNTPHCPAVSKPLPAGVVVPSEPTWSWLSGHYDTGLGRS